MGESSAVLLTGEASNSSRIDHRTNGIRGIRDAFERLCNTAQSDTLAEPGGNIDPPVADRAQRQVQIFLVLSPAELNIELLQVRAGCENMVHFQAPPANDNAGAVA